MQRLLRKKGVEATASASIPRRPADAGPAPLSFAQQRMWVLQRLAPESPFYNVPGAVRLTGSLRPRALAAALRAVVLRHEVLRTCFPLDGGEPVQRVRLAAWVETNVPLPLVDVRPLVEGEIGAPWTEMLRLARREAQKAFDIEHGPLLRARLVRLAARDHVLLLTFHHIITDAWSNGIVVRELAVAYSEFVRASAVSSLPEPALQYGDFAAWQRQQLSGGHDNEMVRKQLDYWRQQLRPADGAREVPLDLPIDRPRPPRLSARGVRVPIELPATLRNQLDELARRHRATRFMVLLAGFAALLDRLGARTGSNSTITIGSPVANRGRAELENLVGFFANTVALRLRLDRDASFSALLDHSREVAHGAFAHQDLPFEELVRELQPERDLSRNPLFQVMFVLQNAPPPSIPMGSATGARREDQLELTSLRLDPGTAKFDLLLDLDDEPDRLRGALEVALDLYDPSTGRRWVSHLLRLLRAAVAAPERPLGQLELLSAAQRQQLLHEWSGEARAGRERNADGPPLFLHDIFLQTAARWPDAVAAVFGRRHLSYGELERLSARRAQELTAEGYGVETVVAVELERGLSQVAAMLAVLRVGGGYMPIDPALPDERRIWMLEQARDEQLDVATPQGDRIGSPLPRSDSASAVGALAYITYTSGSTGTPKGVALPHQALVNLFRWHIDRSPLPRPRTLAFSALGFDAALHEAFTTWGAGGTLVLLSEAQRREPVRVLELCRRQAVERWFLPFVALDALARTARQRPDLQPRALGEVITAGEQLRVEAPLRALFAGLAETALLENHYGPSETHVVSVERLRSDPSQWPGLPPIGRPVDGAVLRVVDAHAGLQPLGVPGELWIAGSALARGYLGQPARTAERFRPDPWRTPAGHPDQHSSSGRVYLTGDLVRQLADGRFDFLGRLDRQVKIRGFRVEPGEVEAVLASHPEVHQAAVVARRGATSADTYLAAYVVPFVPPADAGPWIEALQASLRQRLPDYLCPRALSVLDALPVTTSGKLRRDALPPAVGGASTADVDAVASPLTAATGTRDVALLPSLLCGLWAEVLDTEPGAVHDASDFFRLGGHSLSAVRLLARVHEVCGVELPLAALFEAPTPATLAERVQAGLYAEEVVHRHDDGLVLRAGLAGDDGAVSFAQRRLWLLHRRRPDDAAYHLPVALRLHGQLDARRLRRALTKVAHRQAALRTIFHEVDGEPVAHVLEGVLVPLPLVDLQLAPRDLGQFVARTVTGAIRRPFDLTREVPWRALLLRQAPDEHALVLVLHHIAGDGWSLEILARELTAAYAGETLPRPTVQYADFAAWQRQRWSGKRPARGLDWWRHQLTPLPARLRLPWDRPPREQSETATAALARLTLSPAEVTALHRLARAHSATLFVVLAAAWQTLLARAADLWHGTNGSDRRDVSLGMAVGGRPRPELERLIGLFVDTLVLRVDLLDASVETLLARVRRALLDAHAHGDVPLDLLVQDLVSREIAAERRYDASPLFQVLLTLQNTPTATVRALPGLEIQPWAASTQAAHVLPGAKADLVLSGQELPAGSLRLDLEYRRDRFDATTALRLLRQLGRLLAGFAAQPERAVTTLPLLDAGQRHQVLVEWSTPVQPSRAVARSEDSQDSEDISGRFLRIALQQPEAVAVVEGRRALSYGELARRSGRRAAEMAREVEGPETIVAVTVERSTELIVELLAVLRTGAAYLPVDPEWPESRKQEVVAQNGAHPPPPVQLTQPPDSPHSAPTPSWSTSRLAYLIATSGSTGTPKAVAVPHGAVLRLVDATPALAIHPGDTVAQAASATFDAATYEMWGALLAGARLALVPKEIVLDPPRLASHLRRQAVDVLFLTTALLNSTIRSDTLSSGALRHLRLLLFGGEAVDATIVRRLLADDTPRTLLHVYGPTENTTFSTWQRVTTVPADAPTVPIGYALGGSGALVLDPWFEPVAAGHPGQLYLDGSRPGDGLPGDGGLARGYHRQPALTADAFLPHAWPSRPGARMYRSGDWVRRRGDGALEFLSRLDRQVKLRGLRIEPAEIEAALTDLDGVAQAAVEVHSDLLVAWVSGPSILAPGTLREQLRRRLPAYMVPSTIRVLDTLPLTAGGKLDRRALADLSRPSRAGADRSPEAATNLPTALAPDVELMATLWADLLDLDAPIHTDVIHTDADLFALGGHSLLAADLIRRVREAFGVELPLAALFENPTISALTQRVHELATESATGTALSPVTATPRQPGVLPDGRRVVDVAPLSFAQERAWARFRRLTPTQRRVDAYYNIPQALHLRGGLDLRQLHDTWCALVRRHEPLRTTLHGEISEPEVRRPVQTIHPAPGHVALPLFDLQRLDAHDSEEEQRRLLHREARRGFDLERGPLLRVHLLRRAVDTHVLLVVLHHAVADGASLPILARELETPSAAPLPIRYADYARWQQTQRGGTVLDANLEFWRRRLLDHDGPAPPPSLPYDRPPSPANANDLRGGSVAIDLPADLDAQLRHLGRTLGVTPFMLLLSAFLAFLHRQARPVAHDLTVGIPAAGRDRPEVADLIGFFVHVQLLRAEIGRLHSDGTASTQRPTFLQLAEHVRQRALEAQRYQDVPFPRLIEACAAAAQTPTNGTPPPLFRVMFALQNLGLRPPRLQGLEVTPITVDSAVDGQQPESLAKFDLTLSILPMADTTRNAPGTRYQGHFEYRAAVFDRLTVQRLAQRFPALLTAALEAPTRQLDALSSLTRAERHQLWVESPSRVNPHDPEPSDQPDDQPGTEQADHQRGIDPLLDDG